MTEQRWTLLDADQGLDHAPLRLEAGDLGPGWEGCRIDYRRRQGGLQDGVGMVRIECGDMVVEVLPTRGMGIWKAWLGDEEIGWRSPVRGPVHPGFVPLTEPSGLGWLDGFDELLVRCGLESNGAPEFDPQHRLIYPLHGRIANRPAQRVEVLADRATGELSVSGVVEETRFHFAKLRLTSTVSLRPGEGSLRIRDQVLNLSGRPGEMQLLYHINFGQPLLNPGSRFVAPVARVVPRDRHAAAGIATWNSYAKPQADYAEEVYFLELLADEEGQTQALLKNAAADRGVSIHLNRRQLPCFTLWKNTVAEADGYVTGLEPGTNFPNPRSFEGQRGRVVRLEPGGTAAFDLRLQFHRDAAGVQQAEHAIAELRELEQHEVCHEPQPDWCLI